MASKVRRILVPMTDELLLVFSEFRRIHNHKSWPESKLYRAFAEAGARVWQHEQAGASSVVMPISQHVADRPEPSVVLDEPVKQVLSPTADDDFPFGDI